MPSSLKSRRQVRKAIKVLDSIDPEWRKYEQQMNELAKTVTPMGDPIDVFLLRLYNVAKAMDKPLVEIANA